MRKLNLSKSEANKSPQRTKSFFAMLVLALGLFLGMAEDGKAQNGYCDNCTSATWSANEKYYSGNEAGCLGNCKVIVSYNWRKNTCATPNAMEIKIKDIMVMPAGCRTSCEQNSVFQEAIYYTLKKVAAEHFGLVETNPSNQNLYKYTPTILTKMASCYNSNTYAGIANLPSGTDTNFSSIPHVTGNMAALSSTITTSFSGGTEVNELTNPAVVFPPVDFWETNPDIHRWDLIEQITPCYNNCCQFSYIVQKVPEHNGQQIDVYLAQNTTTFNLLCERKPPQIPFFFPNGICKFICEDGYGFAKWPPFAKRNIFQTENIIESPIQLISTVIPNPANETTKIELVNSPNSAEMKIIFADLNGNIIDESNFNGSISVNTSKLSVGAYHYYILINNTLQSKGKINVVR